MEGKGEGDQLVVGRGLETPRLRAERELIAAIGDAGHYLRLLLQDSAAGREQGEAAFAKVQLTAALEVFDRVHAIDRSNKPAADSGNVLAKLHSDAYRRALARKVKQGKVVEVQPIAAEAESVIKVEELEDVQPTAAAVAGVDRGLGVIPR